MQINEQRETFVVSFYSQDWHSVRLVSLNDSEADALSLRDGVQLASLESMSRLLGRRITSIEELADAIEQRAAALSVVGSLIDYLGTSAEDEVRLLRESIVLSPAEHDSPVGS